MKEKLKKAEELGFTGANNSSRENEILWFIKAQ
jgi:hypothetical protein